MRTTTLFILLILCAVPLHAAYPAKDDQTESDNIDIPLPTEDKPAEPKPKPAEPKPKPAKPKPVEPKPEVKPPTTKPTTT